MEDVLRETPELAAELADELKTMRRIGWDRFRARRFSLLPRLCPPPQAAERPEDPIKRRLLDLLDPPELDEAGLQTRRPLDARNYLDEGLFGRILFGEPEELRLNKSMGTHLAEETVYPREMNLTTRYGLLREIRLQSTINGSTRKNRLEEGPHNLKLLDLRDGLIAAARRDGFLVAPSADAEQAPSADRSALEGDAGGPVRVRIGPRRAATVALAALVIGITLLAAWPTSSAPATARLSASLKAINHSYDPHWGTSIRADPTDQLTFQLDVANRGDTSSRPLAAWIETAQASDVPYAWKVRLDLANQDGAILTQSPWVTTRGWTNQFAFLLVSQMQRVQVLREPGDHRVGQAAVDGYGSYRSPVSIRDQIPPGELTIGKVSAHENIRLRFDAFWKPGGAPPGFGTIPPRFVVLPKPDSQIAQTGAAKPGDTLFVVITLDNQGTFAGFGHIRVVIRPHDANRYVNLSALGTLLGKTQLLGTATINSGDGTPITVSPIPGTTFISGSRNRGRCEPHSPRRLLPDGIAYGGVDIGVFGGFIPHSNCFGMQFDRYVYFRASVSRK